MSAEFSSKLLLLRQSAGLSQKQVSVDLGVSQALLSHYEKGIRECSLDFVVKAAEYYNVSTDFLLGVTNVQKKSGALSDSSTLSTDGECVPLTVLRAIVRLSDEAQEADDEHESFFSDYFSLCIKKYLSALNDEDRAMSSMCDLVLDKMDERANTLPLPDIDEQDTPQFFDTVKGRAGELVRRYIEQLTISDT